MSVGHGYLSFCVLILILSYTPGPNVILMIKYGLEYPLSKALCPIPGIALALLTYVFIVAVGLSNLIVGYPTVYHCLQIVGAAYLIYLGIKGFIGLCYTKGPLFSDTCRNAVPESKKLFMSGYICAITNPKTFIVYLALFPQFIDHTRKSFPQFVLLGATHIFFVLLSMTTYCVLANKSKDFLKKYRNILNFLTSLLLVTLGVVILFEKPLTHF